MNNILHIKLIYMYKNLVKEIIIDLTLFLNIYNFILQFLKIIFNNE